MGGEEGAVGGKGVGEGRADLLEGLGAGGGGGREKDGLQPSALDIAQGLIANHCEERSGI